MAAPKRKVFPPKIFLILWKALKIVSGAEKVFWMFYLRNFALIRWLQGNKRYVSKENSDVCRQAFLFPGQGSQFAGMCGRFVKQPWLQSLFSRANEIIGFDLLKLCLEGPIEELQKTENCQLAVVMASLAGLEWYRYHGDSVRKCWRAKVNISTLYTTV